MKTTAGGGRAWHFSHSIGRLSPEHNESRFGSTGGSNYAMDVAVGNDDVLFILSRGFGYPSEAHGVDIGCRIGKTTFKEHHIGDFARGAFTWPNSIALSSEGKLYCSDEFENKIYVFETDKVLPFPEYDPTGGSIAKWGVKGTAPGQLNGPAGMDFDIDNRLYIVDSLNSRIEVFSKDGEFIECWGEYGDEEGQFNKPWGITIDTQGYVYVADWGNSRVQKFTADGEFVIAIGSNDDSESALDHPSGVAVDSDGDIYVVDWGNRRVQIHEPDGEMIASLYGDAVEFNKAGLYNLERDPESIKNLRQNEDITPYTSKFGRPIGIATDKQDRIIITDIRGRLQIYSKDKEYAEPSA